MKKLHNDITVGFELEFIAPYVCDRCDGHEEVVITCPSCNGYGDVECPACNGRGYVEDDDWRDYECGICQGQGVLHCHQCEGSGDVITPCPECGGEGSSKYLRDDLENLGCLVHDGSILSGDDEGLEFNSRVLYFNAEEYNREYVENVVSIIEQMGGISDPEYMCGLHVHVGLEEGWTLSHAKNLGRAWLDWAEDLFINTFCPDGDRLDEYCQMWQWFDNMRDEVENAEKIHHITYDTRYLTLNMQAYRSHDTVEFRLFDGTLDDYLIVKAITWCAALVAATKEGVNGSKERFEELVGIATPTATAAIA